MKLKWIDTRLSNEEMNFLRDACSVENKENYSKRLAGNISKSEQLCDKDNWFYETVLKKSTERLFYRNCSNYYEDYIEKEESLPKFEIKSFWVNYQKQHEFNPIHDHSGLFSFVVFMKITTNLKEQHALPFYARSNHPSASDFAFVWSEKDSEICEHTSFQLSPDDEGRMLFFPAKLKHMVYPFYGTEEERVTISGNIFQINDLNVENNIISTKFDTDLGVNILEEKENILKMMKNSVKSMEEELKQMKKEREKEGLN